MPRQKKDGRHINYYIDRKIFDKLKSYSQEEGQTVTTALEYILTKFFEQQKQDEWVESYAVRQNLEIVFRCVEWYYVEIACEKWDAPIMIKDARNASVPGIEYK